MVSYYDEYGSYSPDWLGRRHSSERPRKSRTASPPPKPMDPVGDELLQYYATTHRVREVSSGVKFATRDILDCQAQFTWYWGCDFFVETPFGNFHWKDPEYEGDNSFTLFHGDINDFRRKINMDQGRDKGFHNVERYCGSDIVIYTPLLPG